MKANRKNAALCKVLRIFSQIIAALVAVILVGIILYVCINGIPNLSWHLLFGKYSSKAPSLLPAILGTLMLILIAVGIAAPIGICSAIFLTEYAGSKNRLVVVIRVATETLAGIPSIVYGLFGYIVFVVGLKLGYSLLGGGLTLAVMILPVIVRSVEESLLAVPQSYREESMGLGCGKVRTIFRIVLPSASSGIVTSIILAAGRVISESAVLILTIGMVVNKAPTGFLSAGTSLALDVYYFGSHGDAGTAAATGIVLIALIAGINLLAGFVGKLMRKKMGGK